MQTEKLLSELAGKVDCFTQAEMMALAGIDEATEQAWRKRRTSPPYVRLGAVILYPRAPLQRWIESKATAPTSSAPEGGAS